MTFYERMIEVDYNPFILFSQAGKVLSLNKSAQFLLGSVSAHTIFEHAINHATTSFGFKTTHIDLNFGRFHFFALCVGYENEEELGIMLYRTPSMEAKIDSSLQKNHNAVNIYSLIDLCISTTSIGNKRSFVRDFDPTLPEIRIDADKFIRMFSLILGSSSENSNLSIKLSLNIGEHIRIADKKYSIFSLRVSNSSTFDENERHKIESFRKKLGAKVDYSPSDIIIDMAIIT